MPRTSAPAESAQSSVQSAILETLAHQLELVEFGRRACTPDQYRALVTRLSEALAHAPPDVDLTPLLAAFPSTAELYENLHYQVAGLCRSPLEFSLLAEIQARQALDKARQHDDLPL